MHWLKKHRDDLKLPDTEGVPVDTDIAACRMETDGAAGAEIDTEAVLIKIYDHKDIHRYMDDEDSVTLSLKLNDMIEVVGIYTAPVVHLAPVGTEFPGYDVFSGFEGLDGAELTSKLPTLHCILLRRLGSTFPICATLRSGEVHNPFLHNAMSSPGSTNACAEELQRVGKAVADALGGDVLSANYVALSIISRVLSRDRGVVVGPLHLNICAVSPMDPRVEALSAVLRNIVPRLVEVVLCMK